MLRGSFLRVYNISYKDDQKNSYSYANQSMHTRIFYLLSYNIFFVIGENKTYRNDK